MSALAGLLFVAAALLLLPTGYLGLLALLARRPEAPPAQAPSARFAVVVPAHNEEAGIAATVSSLLALDYPPALFEVVVVADNCGDETAARAREAGARVLERHDEERRGKGYALEHAFGALLEQDAADALVVVDADTLVSPNLLSAFDARLRAGEVAVQAEYGVSNVDASWRTKLMTIALATFHGVRSSARERLRLSAGLRGNGMCFSRGLLLAHPHEAYGLVEDVEYGIEIGLHGHRVAWAGEAVVRGEMASGAEAAASQRRRWEGGRARLLREKLLPLLKRALSARSGVCLDLAFDLLVPPLSTLALGVFAGLCAEAVHFVFTGALTPAAGLLGLSALCLVLYVGRGVALSGLGLQGVGVLLWAPVFVLWKVLRVRPRRGEEGWVRTRREAEAPPEREG